MKILLLEDEDAIGTGLQYSLEKDGYEVVLTKTKKEAESIFQKDKFDLCILDINLPDGSGYDVCRHIKSQHDTPVIFLTASDAEVNVVMGLEIGADDYICKPFRVNELMARMRAVLRRAGKGEDHDKKDGIIRAGAITINTKEARVTCKHGNDDTERTVELTALEYRLLLTLCNNRGMIMSRNTLLSELWDIDEAFVDDNTLSVYIKRLREKIEEDPADPKIIKTVRKMGYIMEGQEE